MISGDTIVARFDRSYCGSASSNVELTKWDIHLGYFLEVIVCAEFYFIIFLCVYENNSIRRSEREGQSMRRDLVADGNGTPSLNLYQPAFFYPRKKRDVHFTISISCALYNDIQLTLQFFCTAARTQNCPLQKLMFLKKWANEQILLVKNHNICKGGTMFPSM